MVTVPVREKHSRNELSFIATNRPFVGNCTDVIEHSENAFAAIAVILLLIVMSPEQQAMDGLVDDTQFSENSFLNTIWKGEEENIS
jgi:hypothetical protein